MMDANIINIVTRSGLNSIKYAYIEINHRLNTYIVHEPVSTLTFSQVLNAREHIASNKIYMNVTEFNTLDKAISYLTNNQLSSNDILNVGSNVAIALQHIINRKAETIVYE